MFLFFSSLWIFIYRFSLHGCRRPTDSIPNCKKKRRNLNESMKKETKMDFSDCVYHMFFFLFCCCFEMKFLFLFRFYSFCLKTVSASSSYSWPLIYLLEDISFENIAIHSLSLWWWEIQFDFDFEPILFSFLLAKSTILGFLGIIRLK